MDNLVTINTDRYYMLLEVNRGVELDEGNVVLEGGGVVVRVDLLTLDTSTIHQ